MHIFESMLTIASLEVVQQQAWEKQDHNLATLAMLEVKLIESEMLLS